MKKRFSVKSVFTILLVFTLVVSMFPGCSSKAPQGQSQQAAATTSEPTSQSPFSISIIMNYFTAEPPEKDGPTEKALEEYTNTKLDISWLPSAAYDDKFNVMVSSGDMPMIILVKDNKMPMIVQAVSQGAFWELTPHLKSYKNLAMANSVVQNNVCYDGKTYGLYRMRTLARYGFIFRRDWLDTLGLKEPGSIDELYNVMKAFTLNDPDKNGVNDTMGMVERDEFMTHDGLVIWHGGPNNWKVDNGKMTPAFLTKEYMDANNFMKRLYNEKLINGDFAVAKKTQTYDFMNKGTAGMYYGSMDDSKSQHGPLFKANPKAKIDVFSQIKGPKELRLKPTTGWNGMLFFNKKAVKTEADLKKCLAFVDKLDDQKMQDFLLYGVEGRHFEKANGLIKPIAEKNDLYQKELGSWSQLSVQYSNSKSKADSIPVVQRYEKMWEDNEKYVVANPCEPFISATYSTNGTELDKIIKDARTKYIMGALDEAGWQKATDQWLKSGGDKIIKEFEEAYSKISKK